MESEGDMESEFVARVVVERIDRVTVPSARPRVVKDGTERHKFEIASFAIRASDLDELRRRVQNMMDAALPAYYDVIEGPIQGEAKGLRNRAAARSSMADRDLTDNEDEDEED